MIELILLNEICMESDFCSKQWCLGLCICFIIQTRVTAEDIWADSRAETAAAEMFLAAAKI